VIFYDGMLLLKKENIKTEKRLFILKLIVFCQKNLSMNFLGQDAIKSLIETDDLGSKQ
jgi:hypothetical protein